MSTLVIALICFSVAFVGGTMLSKAYFATRVTSTDSIGREKHHALLQAQRVRYRKRMVALNNVIRKHEETRFQIRDKLEKIEQKFKERSRSLQETQEKLKREQQQCQDLKRQLEGLNLRNTQIDVDKSNSAAMEKEFGMLRIERDELAARIKRMESEQAIKPAVTNSGQEKDKISRMRAEMGELRETMATRDRRIHDLEIQLKDSTDRTRQLQAKLDSWKQRVMPLTRKLKQQKEVIRKFCLDDASDSRPESAGTDSPDDDLKAIHGIGPALEKRLQQYGIRQYHQLAELTGEELAEIARQLGIAPHRAERDGWIRQARNLLERTDLLQTV